jgi:uncharacterized membrane protein YcfT
MRKILMKQRLDWMDYIRGFIVLWMVWYQCAIRAGYTHAAGGWFEQIALFGEPVRMQTLFLISGLLFTSSLHKSWQELLHSRLLNLVYLFVLWSFIGVVLHSAAQVSAIPLAFVDALFIKPIISLWFILVLALFMAASRLLNKASPFVMLGFAVGLELLQLGPFWTYSDNFTHYFIYFLIGLYAKEPIMVLAAWLNKHRIMACLFLIAFLGVNFLLLQMNFATVRGVGLMLSLFGLGAMVVVGANSLVFYLGYMPFMLIASLFLKTRLQDPSLYALALWVISVAGAFILWFLAQKWHLNFLYAKPKFTAKNLNYI